MFNVTNSDNGIITIEADTIGEVIHLLIYNNDILNRESNSIILSEENYYRLCFEYNKDTNTGFKRLSFLYGLPISISNIENIIVGYKPK